MMRTVCVGDGFWFVSVPVSVRVGVISVGLSLSLYLRVGIEGTL